MAPDTDGDGRDDEDWNVHALYGTDWNNCARVHAGVETRSARERLETRRRPAADWGGLVLR